MEEGQTAMEHKERIINQDNTISRTIGNLSLSIMQLKGTLKEGTLDSFLVKIQRLLDQMD